MSEIPSTVLASYAAQHVKKGNEGEVDGDARVRKILRGDVTLLFTL